MDNIFKYLFWRGDITLDKSEFNNIDALILARLSYFPFDDIIPTDPNKSITIEEAYNMSFLIKDLDSKLILKNDKPLLKILSKSERFKDMKLHSYVNDIDLKTEKQFSAITINTEDGYYFVAFRGTDTTLVGWKEDFNMSFMDIVPAQIESKNYLEEVINKTNSPLRVAGHSKGGNLAIYSSAFVNEVLQDRIEKIYNFDGPGLNSKLVEKDSYMRILPKIHTYMPQSSMVGILLEHKEEYSIIYSYEKDLNQHDLYSWKIDRDDFLYMEKTSASSIFVDNTLREWISKVDEKQRGQFFDVIYQILEESHIKGVDVLNLSWAKLASTIIFSLSDLDDEVKDMVKNTFRILAKSATNNLDIFPTRFPKIFSKNTEK